MPPRHAAGHAFPNILQPEGWIPAKGYANGIEVRGRMVFVTDLSLQPHHVVLKPPTYRSGSVKLRL